MKSLFFKYKNIFEFILGLSQNSRKFIILIIDILIIFFTYYLCLYIQNYENILTNSLYLKIILINIFILLNIYYFTGNYKGITRYAGSKYFYSIISRNFLGIFLLICTLLINKIYLFNFRFYLSYWIFLCCLIIASRILMRDLLIKYNSNSNIRKKRIAIYGAGKAGVQLQIAFRINRTYEIVTFIDDDKDLWSRSINGVPINDPKKLKNNEFNIEQILLAIPNIDRERRKEIYLNFANMGIPILEMAAFEKINREEDLLNSLKKIEIEDLLGREPAMANEDLLKESIQNKIILITGAGGSIGSELCKEVIKIKPKKLIILERSELLLYKIDKELSQKNKNIVTSILGSITDEQLIKKTLVEYKVEVIIHTAAYKHVPIVENNPIQGIYNNVIGTNIICKSANSTSTKKVILISSDKAVRPTNIMGASKRLSELLIKWYAKKSRVKNNTQENSTIFSMVRFGNVLGSSGSVVPLFKEQIEKGGPVTITNKNIIRYFMTINEASQLVLQAISLAKTGDLLLLDMGTPMKIIDLAKQMITLSGLTIKDESNKNGNIEIKITKLRKGEKLYEELLINNESEKTIHPLIFKAKENEDLPNDFENLIFELESNLINYNEVKVFNILKRLVPEWKKTIN